MQKNEEKTEENAKLSRGRQKVVKWPKSQKCDQERGRQCGQKSAPWVEKKKIFLNGVFEQKMRKNAENPPTDLKWTKIRQDTAS